MCPPPTAIGEVAKVDSLRAAFEAASNKSQREAALQEITTYLSNRGKAVEPFVGSKQLLPSILKAFGDKVSLVASQFGTGIVRVTHAWPPQFVSCSSPPYPHPHLPLALTPALPYRS
jgi:hypothetical protein